jgi:hypothetical protein
LTSKSFDDAEYFDCKYVFVLFSFCCFLLHCVFSLIIVCVDLIIVSDTVASEWKEIIVRDDTKIRVDAALPSLNIKLDIAEKKMERKVHYLCFIISSLNRLKDRKHIFSPFLCTISSFCLLYLFGS